MNSSRRPFRVSAGFFAGVLGLSVVPASAGSFDLADAIFVREALGPRTSAEVIRIEHCVRGAARVSFATVFEFSGLLWLYRPERGTESIAAAQSTRDADDPRLEALIAPMYRACGSNCPTTVRPIETAARSADLPRNGCVPEAIAFLRRLASEQRVEEARLLFYYYREVVPGTAFYLPQAGHTVLLARVAGTWRSYDVMLNREVPLGRDLASPTAAARAVELNRSRDILSARYLRVPTAEFVTVRF
jgi:hypothetical protein